MPSISAAKGWSCVLDIEEGSRAVGARRSSEGHGRRSSMPMASFPSKAGFSSNNATRSAALAAVAAAASLTIAPPSSCPFLHAACLPAHSFCTCTSPLPHNITSTPSLQPRPTTRSFATIVALGSRIVGAGANLLSGWRMATWRVETNDLKVRIWDKRRRSRVRRVGWRRRMKWVGTCCVG